MIKVNLLPVKKKKKSKPIPGFIFTAIGVTVVTVFFLVYLVLSFSDKLSRRQKLYAENEKKIAELKQKIKAVEDFEKQNADFKKRKDVIEQLGKSKTLPVKVIDELSALLPPGVWLNSLSITGIDITLACIGFTNTDVVNYVNNLKNSKMFTDVNLQESVQSPTGGFTPYSFRLTLKVKES